MRIVQESLIGHGLTKMRVHNLILNFVAFDIYICNSLLQLYKKTTHGCQSVCPSVHL